MKFPNSLQIVMIGGDAYVQGPAGDLESCFPPHDTQDQAYAQSCMVEGVPVRDFEVNTVGITRNGKGSKMNSAMYDFLHRRGGSVEGKEEVLEGTVIVDV